MRLLPARSIAAALATLAAACGLSASGTGENLVGADSDGSSGMGQGFAAGQDGAVIHADAAGDARADGGPGDGGPCSVGDGGTGTSCGSGCVDTKRDRANCGGCGVACAAQASCEAACVDVAASLVGFRLEIPCDNNNSPYCGTSNSVVTKTAVLTGTAGKTYTLDLRFRGVVEQKTMSGSAAGNGMGTNAGFFVVGGSPASDNWNAYSLALTTPTITYYLNKGASQHSYVDGMDYHATVTAAAGATFTMKGDPNDSAQAGNHDVANTPVVIAGVVPAPKAFDGQFIQIDIQSVTPAM